MLTWCLQIAFSAVQNLKTSCVASKFSYLPAQAAKNVYQISKNCWFILLIDKLIVAALVTNENLMICKPCCTSIYNKMSNKRTLRPVSQQKHTPERSPPLWLGLKCNKMLVSFAEGNVFADRLWRWWSEMAAHVAEPQSDDSSFMFRKVQQTHTGNVSLFTWLWSRQLYEVCTSNLCQNQMCGWKDL